MLRILLFFVVVLAAGLGFAWLADHPGEVSIAWLGTELQLSFLTFLAAAVLLIVAVLALVWILSNLFDAPARIGRYVSGRSREKGYRALTGGILAAGAGDAATARRLVVKSQRYLDARKEPLLRFLDAQTAMIEGDHARARRVFEAMESDPNTRLLALRGLYLESERVNDAVAARHYAEQAVRIAPHVPWAGGAVLELKAAEKDYDSALEILKAQRSSRLVDKKESDRLRAVLLTGKAQSLLTSDPAAAKSLAMEASKLAPSLVPAALTAARAAIASGDFRRATKVLEKAWTDHPHPQIAELYVHARPGESASERLARARRLQQIHPDSADAHMAVAHAALDARALPLARSEAEAAAAKSPRESVYLLLADIEEAEGGGEGRVRAQMAKALRAPKDPSWSADGASSAEWSPVSPVTGRLDAFRWSEPEARPAPLRTISHGEEASKAQEAHPSDDGTSTALVALNGAADPADGHRDLDHAGPASKTAGESDPARKEARFNV